MEKENQTFAIAKFISQELIFGNFRIEQDVFKIGHIGIQEWLGDQYDQMNLMLRVHSRHY